MPIVLTNAILVDIDPLRVERGNLRIDGGTITARGADAKTQATAAADETIDCGGAVVLPGLVNGHTHLYSALAVGMPAPPKVPTNFHEILRFVWWRLDQALDADSIEASARIGALEALHCGTTTLIDHHASPRAIEGSLDLMERGIDSVGLRGVLCYEVTDRHGKAGREAALEESRRYIAKYHGARRNDKFAALSGAHASFTLDDLSLDGVENWADEFSTGVHIHVAEDPCDDRISRERYKKSLIERLARAQMLGPQHVLGHCIHLDDDAIALLNEARVTVAHNPRSNMNNAVGYAPVAKLTCPIMLGTDGIGADLFAEAQAAWWKSRDGGANISPARVVEMLAQSARRASQALHVTLGKLETGAAADVVITDYVPFTELTAANFPAHFIFAMGSRHVKHVIARGRVALRDRVVRTLDEPDVRRRSVATASAMWKRMESIPC
jgi:putative selenium metabolism protein SsnA